MRIGILTFHRACNYGALLQAFALQKTVTGLEKDCRIIDYRNEEIEKSTKIFFLMSKDISFKHILAAVLNMPLRLCRKAEFIRFTKRYLKLTEPVTAKNGKKCSDMFDIILVGSDQVWNDRLTGFDRMYFLDPVRDSNKKYSYAASFGFHEIPDGLEQEYEKLLSGFKGISVREESGQHIIERLLLKKARLCVDPVFLLNREVWERLCLPVRNSGKYILIYSINKNRNLIDFARNLSKSRHLPLFYILMDVTSIKRHHGMKFVFSPSPQRFLSLIKNAAAVVTNSFHGTAFSILFQKEFYSEIDYGEKYNYRIESILNHMELRDRIICSADAAEEAPIDWARTNSLLEEYREDSVGYLKEVLNIKDTGGVYL